jgi:hypothetical protein
VIKIKDNCLIFFSNIFYLNRFFCSTLSKFEKFLLCERILINVKTKRQANFKVLSNLEPVRGSSNKKTLYSTRSWVNWAFFGTRGPLKRSFHSRFKMAPACQNRPNLHTNSSNKLLLSRISFSPSCIFSNFSELKRNNMLALFTHQRSTNTASCV